MRQLIRYSGTGESRVIDTSNMTASQFLAANDLDAPLDQYELDCELGQDDISEPHVVVREKKSRIAVSLGRRGGKVKSEAKAKAARNNGATGGRPRKEQPKQ